MTRHAFILSFAFIFVAACSGQRQTVEKGTTLTTDTNGVEAGGDIQVKSEDDSKSDGVTVKESDDLLPSNNDDIDDEDGNSDSDSGLLQDRSHHARSKKGPSKKGSAKARGRSREAHLESLRKNITVGVASDEQASQNADKSFIPASITKLITTGMALETLGPNFHFTHTFSFRMIDKASGVIAGLKWQDEGDPSLANRVFEKYGERHMPTLDGMTRKLRAAGIRSIKGKVQLVSADSRLDAQMSAPGVEASDRRTVFGAFPVAFTYAHNFPIRTATAGKENLHTLLLRSLKSAGIAVDESASLEGGSASSLQILSPALSEIIIPMNKASDNLIADTLFLTLARRAAHPGQSLNDAGRSFYQTMLHKWLRSEGTPRLADELSFYDGSGLSRNDRVSPAAFLAVLKYYVKQSYFKYIFTSLPIAGKDGTLGHRMPGKATRGVVRAKTGTVRGNYQLAGYIPRMSGDGKTAHTFVPFVVLTHTPDGTAYRYAAHGYQDEIVARLADKIN